jgi:hypothetical protein
VKEEIKRVKIGRISPRKYQTGGETPKRELLFSQDVKGGENKRGMKIGGASLRNIPFSIEVKGREIETSMRRNGHRGNMSMVFPCLSVSINAKGGYFLIVGCH